MILFLWEYNENEIGPVKSNILEVHIFILNYTSLAKLVKRLPSDWVIIGSSPIGCFFNHTVLMFKLYIIYKTEGIWTLVSHIMSEGH